MSPASDCTDRLYSAVSAREAYSVLIQVLLPLQTVRGNFARIHSVLNELVGLSERFSGCESASGGGQLDLEAVQLAVRDAVAMFQRQAQGLLQVHPPYICLIVFVFVSVCQSVCLSVLSVLPVKRINFIIFHLVFSVVITL